MHLFKVEFKGYKRLRDIVTMDADPAVVCIVGPNAAGKSSLLDALVHLNDDRAFEARERTRGLDPSEKAWVSAYFYLEQADLDAISAIPEARSIKTAEFFKVSGSGRGLQLQPEPKRDLRPRIKAQKRLEKLLSHPWLPDTDAAEEDASLRPRTQAALGYTSQDDEKLGSDVFEVFQVLATQLEGALGLPEQFAELPELLRQLVQTESTHPHDEAQEILKRRVPRFLKFDESARNLQPSYDLEGEDDLAIRNLLQLAGTSWESLQEIYGSGDKGRKVAALDAANQKLHKAISSAWGQADLTVRLDLDESVLAVLMSMESEDFIEIDQHSDGLRQFVALRSFIALTGESFRPIVLIDEAETHLHYDGQADLMKILQEQDEAAKVIYTTHSAGCLPRDLGLGVRAVVPLYRDSGKRRIQTDYSTITDRLWTHGSDFSPLLLAMGASAFAFSATQRAVVTEGISDALLLPTLIREATGKERLSYQIVPGFSEASKDDVPQFDLLASRVAFVADSDKGGDDHAKKLRKNGVRDQQIVFLGGKGKGVCLEDVLAKEVYVEAVNAELARRHDGVRIKPTDVPDVGRGRAIEKLLAKQTDKDGKPVQVSKPAIAQRILEQLPERMLVAPMKKTTLRALDRAVEAVFAKATHRL